MKTNKSNEALIQVVLFILSIALATVSGWSNCNVSVASTFYHLGKCTTFSSGYCYGKFGPDKCQDKCFGGGYWQRNPCNSSSDIFVKIVSIQPSDSSWCTADNQCGNDDPTIVPYILCCQNQCEADSATCVSAGNVWQDDPSASCGKSCKINHCKAADSTWLSTSIAACTGSNNYAIVNTDSTCEHVGTCCSNDSIPSGNVCKWRCDSALTQCIGAVLPDTSVSGEDTTFSYQCFYNCAYSPNPDSTVYLVEGNTVLSGPNDSIADGIKSEWFSSIRSTTGSIYVYDYLSPSASEYVDSIAAMKCVEHLWRCVINNKYVYWYDNQEVPAGCTNIVRVK